MSFRRPMMLRGKWLKVENGGCLDESLEDECDVAMYSAVPPPEKAEGVAKAWDKSTAGDSQRDLSKERQSEAPSGVSNEKWTRFQELKERRLKCCTTEKRIRKLQKQAANTVFSEMTLPDEVAVLEDRGLAPQPSKQQRRKQNKNECSMSGTKTVDEGKWKQLVHFTSSSVHSSEGEDRKVGKRQHEEKQLNEELDEAIKQKSFDKAEAISMQLVQHNFATKLMKGVECRDYVERKAVEEERVKKKKKPKLHWGFEQKQRWESKGNM